MWQRLGLYVYLSGLLVNVAGTVAWLAWDGGSLVTLVEANVLCLALTSAVWSLAGLLHPESVPAVDVSGRTLPFAHTAAQAAVVLSGLLVIVVVALDLGELPHEAAGGLGWPALAAVAAALLLLLWDRAARFTLGAIYVIALSAVGLLLDAHDLPPRELCHTAASRTRRSRGLPRAQSARWPR